MEFIKKEPIIYVLSGKAGNGKTTAANMIEEIYNKSGKKTITLAYASYLKDYAKNILGWNGNEENKPRVFLQQLGVELIKDKIDDKFLIKRIIDDIKVYSYFFDVVVITDARFEEEIDGIRSNFDNVKVIHIYGKENNLTEMEQKHSTETSLDNFHNYDYEIDNNESLEDLNLKIEKIIKENNYE